MGSSGWSYTVPFQADVNAALQDLRWQVYQAGDYYKETARDDLHLTEAEFIATLEPDDPDGWNDFLLEDWQQAKAARPVTSPDTLLQSQPDSGTHSIIDIERIGDEPDYFVAAPLSDAELTDLFGSTRPTVAQVEEVDHGGRARWHGTYIVAWDQDTPTHIRFVGHSGD